MCRDPRIRGARLRPKGERERKNCAAQRRPRAGVVDHDCHHQDRPVKGVADLRVGREKKNEALCSSGAGATAEAEGSGAGWITGTRDSLESCFEHISAACREVGAAVRPPLHMTDLASCAAVTALRRSVALSTQESPRSGDHAHRGGV